MTGPGSSCGACKFLRRKCTSECVFAPYFCYEDAAAHFAAVHKVFGASNVSKLLSGLPVNSRSEAAITISYEALARMQDPVYGCASQIFALQQQVASLQEEIGTLENQMGNLTVDVSSSGSFQATNSSNKELQVSSQHNELNETTYLSEQAPEYFQAENSSGNHALYEQMNMQIPTISCMEDQPSVPCCNLSLLERHFEGIDQGIFASYPWIANGNISTS